MTKFTKKRFNEALRADDQAEVWHLCAIRLGHTPSRSEVYSAIQELATTDKGCRKACPIAYTSMRKSRLEGQVRAIQRINGNRQAMLCRTDSELRTVAISMLRRLIEEPVTAYTKVPMEGFTHLYFCSPAHGHADYNKVMACRLDDEWAGRILSLGKRIWARKVQDAAV